MRMEARAEPGEAMSQAYAGWQKGVPGEGVAALSATQTSCDAPHRVACVAWRGVEAAVCVCACVCV